MYCGMLDLGLIICVSFFLVVSGIILELVHSVQYVPYMDEVFHIPQVQQYCAYNFSAWDPMITTLPGLYLSSVVMLFPLAGLKGVGLSQVCQTENLRACNIVFCIGNFILLHYLSRKLNENNQEAKRMQKRLLLNATVLTLFPVLYFFTWIYYTDPGSTFFTLLMYALCLRGSYGFSALAGIIAILFRQTNVIWVIFCVGMAKSEVIERQLRLDKKVRGNLNNVNDFEVFKLILKTLFSARRFCSLFIEILCTTFWYVLVLIGFLIFVVLNEGIVVGDRKHHEVSFNFPQIFYFLMIAAAFSFIHMIHPRKILNFLAAVVKNPFKVILFASFAGLLIRSFTYEHKYLLSDNRHYPFYVWSKIFKRFLLARYALILVYMYSLYQFYSLTIHKGFMWRVTFLVCVIACLMPQALLEFRYYIIPFYILRLNMRLPCIKALLLELIFYAFVNAFTVYMFVFRPFHWPNDPTPQRFMW